MSRVLKRPMFRKGGPAMEGVMTGIEDRTNFANGTTQKMIEERAKLLQAVVGQPSRGAALTNFLLQFGPAIASRPTTGNVFADIAGAAQAPAADLGKQIAAEDAFKRQLGLTAASGVISEQAAQRLAEIKAKRQRVGRANIDTIGNLYKANKSKYDKMGYSGDPYSDIKANVDTAVEYGSVQINGKSVDPDSFAPVGLRYVEDEIKTDEGGKISLSTTADKSDYKSGRIYVDSNTRNALQYIGEGQFKLLGTVNRISVQNPTGG